MRAFGSRHATFCRLRIDDPRRTRCLTSQLLSWGASMSFAQLQRREVITLLAGAAIACPMVAHGQAGKPPTIGFLGDNSANWRPYVTVFVDRLRALGWIDGRTVAIEYRWSEGRQERVAEIAHEFVRRKVDVIITSGDAVAASKRATSEIPIVVALANDPVGAGLVASLARPGGNVTGLSNQSTDLFGKRLELMGEVVCSLRRLAIMSYGPNFPDFFRRSAEIIDKILRGAKPADIPVEQPTKFDLVLNLATAKALGLKIPETLLLRADEIVE
ncbi:MAG: ABC transporter substrate-binding protein [Hyphomicrobiales bacterium]|nr:ABC transporter substrate-binding protein [Hyphomicrobiales bacterium]